MSSNTNGSDTPVEKDATVATVKKVKTAFLFYQADQLSKIRAELGLSMGDAMTQVCLAMFCYALLCYA
jgi:hypothetical protein